MSADYGEEYESEFPEWFDEAPVEVDQTTSNVVVVDNIPVAEMSRYEKLVGVIRKTFAAYGNLIDLYVPVSAEGPDGKTLGYAFIEYSHPDEASRAIAEGNGKKLDAKHTFAVNSYEDFQRLQSLNDEWTPPKKSEFEKSVNLDSWLYDEFGRDQFVVRAGVDTQIYWNDPYRRANEYGREYKYGGEAQKSADKHWTDSYVAWSTQGRYLVTFHRQGIALWGGENFDKLGRIAHERVANIEFSPCERFILTMSDGEKRSNTDPDPLIVWDVRTQKKLRSFETVLITPPGAPAETQKVPSFFKWSADGSMLARLSPDMISVYGVPDMGLLDKKSLKIPGVADFCWSPQGNLLSYWIPSTENTPATVAIIELPSRKVIREKHLYNVVDVRMHWQDCGDYLAIKVKRRKTKKTITNNFEIFRMREKDIPIEVIEVDDNIVAFSWEPQGSRFAIIHGEGMKTSVTSWSVRGMKIKQAAHFDIQKAVNGLFWSPAGNTLVVAGFGTGFSGSLEWFDIDANESLSANEHFNCNDIEWDPSGRFLLTAVTKPIELDGNYRLMMMDNGYRMWNMQGQLLTAVPLEDAYQVLWRPRPKHLLTKEQLAEVSRTLKEKYWRKFEAEDDEIRRSQLQGRDKERAELRTQWKQYRARKDQEVAESKEARRLLRGFDDNDSDLVSIEQAVEEEISREEEIVQ